MHPQQFNPWNPSHEKCRNRRKQLAPRRPGHALGFLGFSCMDCAPSNLASLR